MAGRINPRAVNKRVLESLAAAGAFDCIEPNRARAYAAVDAILATAQRTQDDTVRGQSELFGGAAAHSSIAVPALEPWLPAERLQREYEAVGFFLSGHPLDDYVAALKRLRVQSWAEFARAVKSGAGAGRVAGTVVSRTERRTKSGSKMGIIGLSDPSGHYEAVLFAEGLAQYRDLLEPGRAVLLFLTAEVQGDEVRARIQSVEPLDEAAARMQRGLRVFLRDAQPLPGVARRLERLEKNGGGNGADAGEGEVSMVLLLQNGSEVEVKLPGGLRSRRRSPARSRRSPASSPWRRCKGRHCCAAPPHLYKRGNLTRGPWPRAVRCPALKRPGSRSAADQPENIIWRCQTSACASFWKLACISAISPTVGTRRCRNTSSAPATTSTSSI